MSSYTELSAWRKARVVTNMKASVLQQPATRYKIYQETETAASKTKRIWLVADSAVPCDLRLPKANVLSSITTCTRDPPSCQRDHKELQIFL